MDLANYEVAQVAQGDAQSVIQMDAIEKANVDVQVSTAKQFPRNVTRAIQNSIVMATIAEPSTVIGLALRKRLLPFATLITELAKAAAFFSFPSTEFNFAITPAFPIRVCSDCGCCVATCELLLLIYLTLN